MSKLKPVFFTNEKCCVNCEHHMQHYIRYSDNSKVMFPMAFGHCRYPHMKDRTVTDTCKHFEEKSQKN